ncbi:MAG TPA: LytTR family DNA-binding domain-containing protein [Acidobacteriaceae bacterium]|nr:LytTR family DNA-binding domain-containing protein [Acidobacteriaceae bacterium]
MTQSESRNGAAGHNGRSATAPARVLVVEDEEHARRYIRELLEDEPQIEVVGESSNGVEGVQKIRELSPDIVFVDVQMPGLDGFGMIDRIAGIRMPLFVFVTGYGEYAVKAFEIEAVDYLCKPFDQSRLSLSVERALRRLNASVPGAGEGQWITRLSIRDDERILFVPVEEIIWIEAANKYVVIHTPGGTHISRQTIQGLEENLNPAEFVRTHRSTLVRKAAVRGMHPLFHGDYIIRLANGDEAPLSRGFRESFFREMSR